jgi:hypothetical protein|nr:MAG TPA: hypothetical protein [Caudoviricetes sp.]
MKNNTIKLFDHFISSNFFGYSAHTLYQELCHSYPAEVATQWIYVNIWHTFIDQSTPEDIDIARHVACIIIGDPNFEIRALDARDWIEYCMTTQEYERLAVLIDEALDLYIDRVISLDEFKLIVSVAQ